MANRGQSRVTKGFSGAPESSPSAMRWATAAESVLSRRHNRFRPRAIIPWAIVAVVVVLVALFALNIVTRVLARPIPQVVAVSAENNAPGLFYTVWVKCTVRNSGGKGTITVTATLEGGGAWAMERPSFFDRDEQKRLLVPFLGVAFLEEGISAYRYNCSARPRGFKWARNFY